MSGDGPRTALPYYGAGICHCIGDGRGGPCVRCPNAFASYATPPELYRPAFVPWSKEAELVESWTRKKGIGTWRIKPRRRRG